MSTSQFSEIYLGADHGGYEFKTQLKPWLEEQGYTVHDCGANTFDAVDDYPQFAFAVAEAVAHNSQAAGILLCRSGAGMTIAANKVPGSRAVVASTEQQAQHAREHNDATVLTLSGDWMTIEEMKKVVTAFLQSSGATDERHLRRVTQISTYEESNS